METAFISAIPLSNKSFLSSSLNRRTNSQCRLPLPCSNRQVLRCSMGPNDGKKPRFELSLPSLKLPDLNVESIWNTTQKALAVAAVTFALVAFNPDVSEAARSGGRVGGSQFRSAPARPPPTRSYSTPSPGYGGGYGYGYGFGPSLFLNPFIGVPFGGFGLGFGGLGSLIAIATIVSFISEARSNSSNNDSSIASSSSSRNTIVCLKLGLLSNARSLQIDLDMMARQADTTTSSGLNYLLQSVLTSLLRHPDYFAYASCKTQSIKQIDAESSFNKIILEERLKLKEETLSNSSGNLYESSAANATETDMNQAPGEYIIVNIIVASADGKLTTQLPKNIDQVSDVDRALKALCGTTKDNIQAVEIIWAPQSLRDTLTEREMLEDHPELKRL